MKKKLIVFVLMFSFVVAQTPSYAQENDFDEKIEFLDKTEQNKVEKILDELISSRFKQKRIQDEIKLHDQQQDVTLLF